MIDQVLGLRNEREREREREREINKELRMGG